MLSAEKLIEVLDRAVDEAVFNFIHASAAYTQLVKLKQKRRPQPRDWDGPVLLRLHARVEDMMVQDQLPARELSNVLWGLAQLSERFSIPTQLLAALVKSVPAKVKGMNAFDLLVLEAVPVIVAQIPDKAPDMIPQHLSNCLWASAQLKDEVPKVLEIVPAMVGEISLKINDMVPQALSNSLEALLPLQDQVPEVEGFLAAGGRVDDILSAAAVRLNTLLPNLRGKDFSFTVPVVVWACAKAGVYYGESLGSVARRLGSRTKLSFFPDFGVCALSWSYQVLDTEDECNDFKTLLGSEATKRGLSEATVRSCQFGRSGWNRT